MTIFRSVLLGLVLLTVAVPATAQQTTPNRFSPRDWRDRVNGPSTKVLVLGSPHLSDTPVAFDSAVLEPLLERLEGFNPDIIAIEALSGESLQGLTTFNSIYPDSAATFGSTQITIAEMAQATLGTAAPMAELALRQRLDAWPDQALPAERRALAALFAASGDPYSALVQWWRLPVVERNAGDGISAELATALDGLGADRNENNLIGARLAALLGLDRVYAIDDHDADDVMTAQVIESLTKGMRNDPALRSLMADPDMIRLGGASERLATPQQALETYRDLNLPETAALDARLQWLVMIEHDWPDSAGRVRMAEWEARNLRMVAHIREASAKVPGGRILVVVGSSHKAWFEAYLDALTDIEIVDAVNVLR